LQTRLEIARRLGFGQLNLINETEDPSNQVRKMLFAMLDSLKPAKAARRKL
jgi:hypothetical protein